MSNEKPQQNLLAEGTWQCTVLSAAVGEDTERPGVLRARINVRLDDGPSKGRTTTYEDEINAKSSIYVARSMSAVGWKGRSAATLADDCAAWIASTGGKSTAEIKHIPTKKGTIWDKCNSIGRGRKPLATPAQGALADADEALRRAMRDDGSAPPQDDVPHAGDTDDIPFASASLSAQLGEIAKVLR